MHRLAFVASPLARRCAQRQRALPAAAAGGADTTVVTLDDNANEAWVVEAKAHSAKPGTCDFLVTASVRDVMEYVCDSTTGDAFMIRRVTG